VAAKCKSTSNVQAFEWASVTDLPCQQSCVGFIHGHQMRFADTWMLVLDRIRMVISDTDFAHTSEVVFCHPFDCNPPSFMTDRHNVCQTLKRFTCFLAWTIVYWKPF